jgi:secreted Zn-dependent insulinase-like peptidase
VTSASLRTKEEKWYKARYGVTPAAAAAPRAAGRALAIPPPNKFIPEDFALKSKVRKSTATRKSKPRCERRC